MKLFSDCSGPCETCKNNTINCLAGHGDDYYEEIDIKPCPFCGSTNVVTKTETVGMVGFQKYETAVYCKDCGARGPTKGTSVSTGGIALWNTRYGTESKNSVEGTS